MKASAIHASRQHQRLPLFTRGCRLQARVEWSRASRAAHEDGKSESLSGALPAAPTYAERSDRR